MTFRQLTAGIFLILLAVSCSKQADDERLSTHIQGRITVDDTLDNSGDYSNIQLLSTIQNSAGVVDTLFYTMTDSTGYFSDIAYFDDNDIYPMLISRNQNNFGLINIIFADEDTVNITGQLPTIQQSIEVTSPEHTVFETLERVERGFNRIAGFINAGAISEDSVQVEIEKWSNIYWQIFEEHPETHAAKLAGEASARILSGWDDSLMVVKSNQVLSQYKSLSPNIRTSIVDYYANSEGLDAALQYLETLESESPSKADVMDIQMSKVELLYDSSKTDEAQRYLETFKTNYSENEFVQEWAENMSYDLEFLSPGSSFPVLEYVLTTGERFSTEDLQGKPFLIEVTRLDNALYQQQYERTVAIYQIYRNFGLDIITVPVAANQVMLDAFFQERNRVWKFVAPNSFNTDELIETLNLNRVPTRFLVNTDGTIIGRYIGTEYDDIVQGLQKITTLTE